MAGAHTLSLKLRDVVASRTQTTLRVYFPVTAVLSMMMPMDDGKIIEVGTVGSEGIVGVQLVIGETRAVQEVYCQVPGDVIAIDADDFLSVIATSPRLTQLCNQYISGLINFLAQSVACNGLHSVTERCAKWMLMTRDRVSSDDFLLTQEFLAMMLGVRRSGVSVAASLLQNAGLIEYKRGQVHVRNREGLQEAACECYLVTKTEFERALRLDLSEVRTLSS